MANFKAPCEWCESGQVFNSQLGHLYKLGEWETAQSWPMLKFFGQNHLKLNFGPIPWQAAEIIGVLWVVSTRDVTFL